MAEKTGETVTEKKNEMPVVLNVYDLTRVNNYTYWFGFGIFHSGIEVHGKEYAFGAHDFPISGVFEIAPRSCPGFIFRCSIPLGHTKIPPSEFRTFIESAACQYHGDTYHLISKNCNHFTDDISLRLTGKRIPGWINRLARLDAYRRILRGLWNSGAICSCLLPRSLQSTTVKQMPEYHERSDGNGALADHSVPKPEENDDADQTQLLSPLSVCGELAFIKEVKIEETAK